MHTYYVFLALDVAQERATEAERMYHLRRAAGVDRESRLAGLARRAGSFVFGRSLHGRTEGRLPAGQPQH
jgi:hypothetical protein